MLNSKETQQTFKETQEIFNFIQSMEDLNNAELKNNFEKLSSDSKKTLKGIIEEIDAIK